MQCKVLGLAADVGGVAVHVDTAVECGRAAYGLESAGYEQLAEETSG